MIQVAPGLYIDEQELEFQFIRSSGPGGQKVNKASTAVQLRFDAAASPGLSDEVRLRLRELAGRRMTAEGVLVIEASRHRSQRRNPSQRFKLLDIIRAYRGCDRQGRDRRQSGSWRRAGCYGVCGARSRRVGRGHCGRGR